MNGNTISKYLGKPDKKLPVVEKAHEKAELFKIMKNIGKTKKNYDNLLKAYNKVISYDIYSSLNQCAQMFVCIVESFLNETLYCYTYTFKNTIFCNILNAANNPVALNKNDILKNIKEDKYKEALNNLYDSFCKYLEFTVSYNDIEKLSRYIVFFINEFRGNNNLNFLLMFFPHPYYLTISENMFYIPSQNNYIKYFLFQKTAYVSISDEILKLNEDFYTKYLGFNIPEKHKTNFNEMINVLSEIILSKCQNTPKPDTTIYYCIHEFSSAMNPSPVIRHMHKLEFSNKSIRLADHENLQQSGKIKAFTSIDINENDYLNKMVNCYKPQLLYSVLLSIAQNARDFNQVNNIAKALAMTFVAAISKRPIVVVSCNSSNLPQAKNFFKQLICSYESDYSFVVDMGYTLKHLTHKNFAENICKLNNTKIKAFFVDNNEDKISENTKTKLIKTSKDADNIQFFIFQTSRSADYIPTDNLIHINLSDWDCSDKSFTLDICDALWGKLYLPVYGLHLIFKERRSKTQFLLEEPTIKDIFAGMSKDEIIKKISEDFISRCFISKEKAIERKQKRLKDIRKIKANNSNYTEEYIIEQLGDQPLYSTPKYKFIEYADVYLNTQYPKNIFVKYSITSEDINKYIKNEYKDIFPYDPLNLRSCLVSLHYQ